MSAKPDPNKKSHWFLLHYLVPMPGIWQPETFVGSVSSKTLTLPVISALREAQGLPETSKLVTFTYMGYMTKHSMAGTNDAPVPTKMSEAFRQGMMAAMTIPAGLTPMNPYEQYAQESREMMLHANEWAEGHAEATALRDAQQSASNPSQSVVT